MRRAPEACAGRNHKRDVKLVHLSNAIHRNLMWDGRRFTSFNSCICTMSWKINRAGWFSLCTCQHWYFCYWTLYCKYTFPARMEFWVCQIGSIFVIKHYIANIQIGSIFVIKHYIANIQIGSIFVIKHYIANIQIGSIFVIKHYIANTHFRHRCRLRLA